LTCTPAQQARLAAILGAAARGGYPIRVAVIAPQSDLGSVTELWRQPELYARFPDQELSLAYKGPVLIVMPSGVGVASATPLSAAERSATAAAGKAASARPSSQRSPKARRRRSPPRPATRFRLPC
jgi:hypothetical protein